MVGIQLNQEQIEAYRNGATMFVVPIDRKDISISSKEEDFQSSRKFLCEYCGGRTPACGECYGEGWNWDLDCESEEEFISKYSPLQKGDEFFIQEDWNYCSIYSGHYIYKASFSKNYHSKKLVDRMKWQDASQMQEHQSRFKDVCLDVEIKRVQDLEFESILDLGFPYEKVDEDGLIVYEWIADWFDSQYEEKQIEYEDNPYVFAIRVQGIK